MTETGTKEILVIEDENDVIEFLKMALEDAGYSVRTAQGVESAVAALQERRPDLITLDLIMPEKTGIRLYSELKGADSPYKNIPIVIITGVDQNTKGSISFRDFFKDKQSVAKPEAYLTKPIQAKELLETLDTLLVNVPV